MEIFKTNATIEKLHSEKKGTDYVVISVDLSSTYKAKFFPKDAELEIIRNSDLNKLKYNSSNSNSNE